MRPDSQRLDQCQLVIAKPAAMYQRRAGYAQIFYHPAVTMHPAYREPHTTIGFTIAAGDTCPATEVRNDRHGLARLKTRCLIQIDNIARQLMTQNTRVAKKRLCSLVSMQIRPAYPNPPDFQNRMPGSHRRYVRLLIQEITGPYTN